MLDPVLLLGGLGVVPMAHVPHQIAGDPADAAGIAEKTVKVDQVFEPQEEMAAVCREKYRKYLRIHRALKYIDTGRA